MNMSVGVVGCHLWILSDADATLRVHALRRWQQNKPQPHGRTINMHTCTTKQRDWKLDVVKVEEPLPLHIVKDRDSNARPAPLGRCLSICRGRDMGKIVRDVWGVIIG